jgi:uncharacterized protein
MNQDQFIELRNQYLLASRPVNTPEHLKGREKQIAGIKDALSVTGRHAFVYGYRGVGKTSLAQTAAYQISAAARDPIILSCDPHSTFSSLCSMIINDNRLQQAPEKKALKKFGGGFNVAGVGGINGSVEIGNEYKEFTITDTNHAILALKRTISESKEKLIVVIDEFDQMTSLDEQARFASLIKAIADQHVPISFIFCGISDDIRSLFQFHESISRHLHAVKVQRLTLQHCLEILKDAEINLKIAVPDGFRYRISQISDGFPYFVHLIAEKMFTIAYDSGAVSITNDIYEEALIQALTSVEISLQRQYQDALHKNTRNYESIIWAVAGNELLEVNINDIMKTYNSICDTLNFAPDTRANVTTKLNQLTTENYGRLLTKPRKANFSFSEKRMRGYARLCAARKNVVLGYENPNRHS